MSSRASQAHRLAPEVEQRFVAGVRQAERFFLGQSNVHRALDRLTERFEQLEIHYAIVGAMALNAYGYLRTTTDLAVLLRPESLASFKEAALGRGYVEKFPGSKGLRDTRENVKIDVLLTGDFPGDGKKKPIVFPDPAEAALRGERFALLPLARLIELKLASGMTAPHRLRDLADVIGLIRANGLGETLAGELHPYVREKYMEMWRAAQQSDDE